MFSSEFYEESETKEVVQQLSTVYVCFNKVFRYR